jgi:hypothetical protein
MTPAATLTLVFTAWALVAIGLSLMTANFSLLVLGFPAMYGLGVIAGATPR